MADVASDAGEFYEKRTRTCAALEMHADTAKAGIKRLIGFGYVEEVHAAITGRRTRRLRLLPERWPTHATDASITAATGSAAVRKALAQARAEARGEQS